MKKAYFLLIVLPLFISNYCFGQNCDIDQPPGCLWDCRTWSAENKPFTIDPTMPGLNCGTTGLTRWFRFTASSNFVKISMDHFDCSNSTEVNIQVYNSSSIAVSPCTAFNSSDFSTVITTDSLQTNRSYMVRVETNKSIGCDFELLLEGTRTPSISTLNRILVFGDSLPIKGSLLFDSISPVNEYNWTSNNPSIIIETGQGTSLINYSKPRFESGVISLEYLNECSSLIKRANIFADNSFCDSLGNTFPGCDFDCVDFWALDEQFAPNSSNCSGNAFSKWFRVTAASDTIKISSDRNNCNNNSEFNVQIFDDSLNPLTNCTPFRNDNFSTQELIIDGLTIQNQYSILVENNVEIGCDFKLNFEGIETMPLNNISKINFNSSVGLAMDGAWVNLVPNASSYFWEVSDPSLVITGQGSSNITFENPNNILAEFCVTPISGCYKGTKKCQTLDNIGGSNINSPCCIFPNVPLGCTEPGVSTMNACVICSLAGIYQGNNAGYLGVDSFSCGIPHNSAFISVIADASGNIDLTLLTTNCQTGDGLQLIFWDQMGNELDCYTIGGAITTSRSLSNLIPGELYTIQIDGNLGDECDFTIIISGNQTAVLPDPITEIRMIPDTILCSGGSVRFEIDESPNTNYYDWIVPPNIRIVTGGGRTDLFAECIVEANGGGTVQVIPSNYCNTGIATILPVVSVPIPPSFWPPIFVCNSDMPWDTIIKGQQYSFDTYGGHDINIITDLGCDSLIKLSIIPKVQISALIDTTICEGDCIMVGGDCYDDVGGTRIVLVDPIYNQQNGCDSTVNLIIQKLNPSAKIADPDDLPCSSGATINLDGTSSSSGNNVSYAWSASNGGTLVGATNSNIATVSSPGTYFLHVTQSSANGNVICIDSDTVQVAPQLQVLNEPLFLPLVSNACLGETYTYSISPVSGAIDYVWTAPLGATILDNGTSALVTFNSMVSGPVCVQAIGICGDSNNACIPITVNPIPTTDFIVTSPICISESSTVQYTGTGSPFSRFIWNFNGGTPANVNGGGPHEITWGNAGPKTITLIVEENGCQSRSSNQTVFVDSELQSTVIDCNSTPNSVSFSWDEVVGANTYQVNVLTGQTGVLNGRTFLVDNLSPNEVVKIEVIAESATACRSITMTEECIAQDCASNTVNIEPINNICLTSATQPIQINATAGNNTGTFSFSGNGVSNNGIFDPQMATIGTNVITVNYSEGICSFSATISIEVNQTPTSTFNASNTICQTDMAMISYSGTASNNAIFNWNFGNGMVTNGTNSGPFEVSFANAGNETVSLSVEENGCTSMVSSQTIEIQSALLPTTINCSSTVNSVSFYWDEVVGTSNYFVNLLTGQTGFQNGRNYFIGNLNPGEEVQIEVTAESNNFCGNITMSGNCIAQNCPIVSVDVAPVNNICLTPTTQPIQLNATAGTNTGTFNFSGNGVTNTGAFDPQMANLGTNILTVTYTEGSCVYNASINVEVNQTPTATFDFPSSICLTENAMVTYTGSASNNANFNWDFDGGNIVSGSNSGPYEISFIGSGTKTISLSVEENGCMSTIETNQIQIDQELNIPVISCTPSFGEIRFAWTADPNVQDYQVQVLNGPNGVLIGTVYTVSGLSPGENVTIEVIGISANSCPSTGATAMSCTSSDCPPIDLTIAPYQSLICAGDSTVIIFNPMNSNPSQSGIYTWSGTNISADGTFNTAGLPAGEYTIQVEYSDMGCVYQSSQIITIESAPEINATVNSPIWFLAGTGSIDLDITSGVPPYSVFWAPLPGSTLTFLDSLPPGEYCVSAIDQIGCDIKECYSIAQGVYKVNPIQIICAGDRQPLSVFPTTGANFSWSPSIRLSCDDCSTPVANPGKTTVYTVTATLPDGRFASQNVVVIVLPSFICNGLPQDEDKDFAKLLSDIDFQKIKEKDLVEIDKRIADYYLEKEIKIAPNPTDGKVNILTPEKVESVEVFDFSGKQIMTAYEKEVDLSNFAKGVYFIRIIVENQIVVKRVILN